MCGIFFAIKGVTVDEEALSHRMKYRGPDDYNCTRIDGSLLAHSRLSITGVKNGSQPFVDDNYVLACNGEIYNYKELIKEHQLAPTTESDCEVVGLLYEKYGVAGFSRLDGMYAFVLYDTRNQRIYWGRDHIGEKPLYYHLFNDILLIFSELNYVRATNISLTPDYLGLVESIYLQFNEQYTPFINVYEVDFRTTYEYDTRTQTLKTIANVKITDGNNARNVSELIEGYTTRLVDAVQSTLRQGEFEPFLGYTSGYDSNVIRVISSASEIPIKLITLGYEDHYDYDEISTLRRLHNVIGTTDITERYTHKARSSDLIHAYYDSVVVRDALVYDGSGTSYFLLMKRVQELGGRVFISGHGGDDVLLSYPWVRNVLGKIDLSDKHGFARRLYHCGRQLLLNSFEKNKRLWSYRTYYRDVVDILGRNTKNFDFISDTYVNSRSNVYKEIVDGYLSRSGLLQIDRYSMHFGVEARTPLVRKNLLSYVAANLEPILAITEPRQTLYANVYNFGQIYRNKQKLGFRTPLNTNTKTSRALYASNITNFVLDMLTLRQEQIEDLGINALRVLSAASIFYRQYGFE